MGIIRLIVNWLIRLFGGKPKPQPQPTRRPKRDPYATEPERQIRFVVGSGDQPPDSFREPRQVYVSRHGLSQQGVVCPRCKTKVASEGEYHLVQQTSLGEYIPCLDCGTVLLASPDDDIDPVKPGDDYDKKIYHRFAGSVTSLRKYQRISTDPLKIGDWVVIFYFTAVDGRVLHGAEGRIEEITGDRFEVSLSGNTGIGGERSMGSDIIPVPKDRAFLRVESVLREGDPVKFIRGPLRDKIGHLKELNQGRSLVFVEDALHSCPIEHLERYYQLEIPSPPPSPLRTST